MASIFGELVVLNLSTESVTSILLCVGFNYHAVWGLTYIDFSFDAWLQ